MIELVAAAAALVEPMLDGRCDDHIEIAQTIAAGPDITLYLRPTRDHVWICFTAPEGSFATVDVEVETPALGKALNLHASAQLGEWDLSDPEAAPKTPTDERWWKISGWTGTTNRFRPAADGQRLEFLPAAARELQISKARFGRGEWRIKLKIAGLKEGDGTRGRLSWPTTGRYTLKVA